MSTDRSPGVSEAPPPPRTGSDSLTSTLARAWAGRRLASCPESDVIKIKDNILDTLAVALAGSMTPEARRVADALTAYSGGGGTSTVWGTSLKLPPQSAALVNGTSAHARDFDDGGGPGHAGSTVVPAALALGEAVGADGSTFLASVIAGYDIGYRVLQSLGGFAAHTEKGWHTSGSMGSIAASAAAARVVDLSAEPYANALGIAGSFTGGLWAFIDDGAMSKRLHPGKAGETGVDAALLARSGFTGPQHLFEAAWGGIYATYNGGVGFPERAIADLGNDNSVQEAWIKPYACCRGAQSSIDAVLALMSDGLDSSDIETIAITASPTHATMLSAAPVKTVFDAQFDLPYAVSVALVYGSASLDLFDPPRTNEPSVAAMLDRITFAADSAIEMLDGPRLEIRLRDGRELSVRAGDPTNAKGSKHNPMSHGEVVDKARSLLRPFGSDAADQLVGAVHNLDTAEDLSELVAALRSVPAGQAFRPDASEISDTPPFSDHNAVLDTRERARPA